MRKRMGINGISSSFNLEPRDWHKHRRMLSGLRSLDTSDLTDHVNRLHKQPQDLPASDTESRQTTTMLGACDGCH